jgi:hypothetical protein
MKIDDNPNHITEDGYYITIHNNNVITRYMYLSRFLVYLMILFQLYSLHGAEWITKFSVRITGLWVEIQNPELNMKQTTWKI